MKNKSLSFMSFILSEKVFLSKKAEIPFKKWVEEDCQAILDILGKIDVKKLDMSVLSSRFSYCDSEIVQLQRLLRSFNTSLTIASVSLTDQDKPILNLL